MFNVDKRILYIIIAIFAVSTIVQYIQNPMELLALLLTIPGVIVAITFHEFAHAFVADKLGDDTPLRQGRLNLNPLSHIDPVGFIFYYTFLFLSSLAWDKDISVISPDAILAISLIVSLSFSNFTFVFVLFAATSLYM